MARSKPTGFRSRRTKTVAVLGALAIVVSLALPRLMMPADGVAETLPRKGRRQPAQQTDELLRDRVARENETPDVSTTVRPDRPTETAPERPAERVDVERVARAADDLDVQLSLRWDSYTSGAAIRARVEIANCDDAPVWVPAPDEPQRTLAIRVLDENGVTVRHVVEQTADRLPRHMQRLGPGESALLELDVVAHGETPLPPGRYQLAAVYESDKVWLQTGLPVWTAPKGPRHSDRVAFEVTSR